MKNDLALLGLRITLGSILIVHACDKLGLHSISLFWELESISEYVYESLTPFSELIRTLFSISSDEHAFWLASFAAYGELISGIFLIIGILNRSAGLFMVVMMSVAVYYHFPFGFYGSEGGYQWAMLCLGASQAIMFMGAGRFSLYELYLAITTEQHRAI